MESWSIKTQFVYPPPVHVALNEEIPTLAIVRVKPLPDPAWETVTVSMTVHHHLTQVVTVNRSVSDGLVVDDEPDALFFVFDNVKGPESVGNYGLKFEYCVDNYRDENNTVIEPPPIQAIWSFILPKAEHGYLVGRLKVGLMEVKKEKTFGDGVPRQDSLICKSNMHINHFRYSRSLNHSKYFNRYLTS